MSTRPSRLVWIVIAATLVATPSAAQPSAWGRGTGLAVSAGAAADGGEWHGQVGGAVLWELTPFFAVEGAARWVDRGIASSAFAGELSVLVGLGGTRDSFVPYLAGGVGFHRRIFDGASAAAQAPDFYRRRFRAPDAFGDRESFTDPTLVLGTGVDVALSRNVVVRPDVRVLWAIADGRRHPVTVATVSLGYRFEHKPVTPTRR